MSVWSTIFPFKSSFIYSNGIKLCLLQCICTVDCRVVVHKFLQLGLPSVSLLEWEINICWWKTAVGCQISMLWAAINFSQQELGCFLLFLVINHKVSTLEYHWSDVVCCWFGLKFKHKKPSRVLLLSKSSSDPIFKKIVFNKMKATFCPDDWKMTILVH